MRREQKMQAMQQMSMDQGIPMDTITSQMPEILEGADENEFIAPARGVAE